MRLAQIGQARLKQVLISYTQPHANGYSHIINWASLASLSILFICLCMERIYPTFVGWVLSLIFLATLLGAYVVAVMVEKVVARQFIDFRATQYFWVGAVALLGFVAHGFAGDEVNAIFGQDASSFPYATTATTAMFLLWWACQVALVVAFASLGYFAVQMYRNRREAAFTAFTLSINLVSLFLFGLLQIYPEPIRRSNIYQIALAMDFNEKFECEGAQSGMHHVAFIGPEQRRALIAPKPEIIYRSEKKFFKVVTVPASFSRASCS